MRLHFNAYALPGDGLFARRSRSKNRRAMFFTDVEGILVCGEHTRKPLQPAFAEDGNHDCPFCRGGPLAGLFGICKTQNDLEKLLRKLVQKPKKDDEDAFADELYASLYRNGHVPKVEVVDAKAVMVVTFRRWR